MTRPIFLDSRAIALTCTFSASNTSLVRAFNFSGRFNHSVAKPPLFSRRTKSFMACPPAIPPSSAERLKQTRRVGIAVGLRLDQGQFRLLIGLLRVQHRHPADRPELSLARCKIKG